MAENSIHIRESALQFLESMSGFATTRLQVVMALWLVI